MNQDFQILRGGWVFATISDIRKGDRFRVVPTDGPPLTDDNPDGDDIFQAKSDAVIESGQWVVAIEKPAQNYFSSIYLDKLDRLGAKMQVRGADQPGYVVVSG